MPDLEDQKGRLQGRVYAVRDPASEGGVFVVLRPATPGREKKTILKSDSQNSRGRTDKGRVVHRRMSDYKLHTYGADPTAH